MTLASVIIATYNRAYDVCKCLDSLPCEYLEKNNTEVIVVDDGSTDDTCESIKEKYQYVNLIKLSANYGPSHARNIAAQQAAGELLIFLDSDSIVRDGWLEVILNHHDGKSVLIGHIVEGVDEHARSGPRRATFIGRSLPCKPEQANSSGAGNLSFPKKIFDEINGFDEELPYGFEDRDLCIRAQKAGAHFKYLSNAIILHMGSSRDKTGAFLFVDERNCVYAMLKTYRGALIKKILFLVLTLSWCMIRLLRLSLKGRARDGANIVQGFFVGIRNFCVGQNP